MYTFIKETRLFITRSSNEVLIVIVSRVCCCVTLLEAFAFFPFSRDKLPTELKASIIPQSLISCERELKCRSSSKDTVELVLPVTRGSVCTLSPSQCGG